MVKKSRFLFQFRSLHEGYPPCWATKSFTTINPRPEPFSLFVPDIEAKLVILRFLSSRFRFLNSHFAFKNKTVQCLNMVVTKTPLLNYYQIIPCQPTIFLRYFIEEIIYIADALKVFNKPPSTYTFFSDTGKLCQQLK